MKMVSSIEAIARYTLIEALRNRLMWMVLACIVTSFAIVLFLSEIALTESGELRSAVLGAVLRVEAVFLVALFVITSLAREFADKGFDLLASLSLPRAALYAGKFLGFASLTLLIAAAFGLLNLLFVPAEQVAIWTFSLALELLLITALSILCVLTFPQIPVAMEIGRAHV